MAQTPLPQRAFNTFFPTTGSDGATYVTQRGNLGPPHRSVVETQRKDTDEGTNRNRKKKKKGGHTAEACGAAESAVIV